MFVSVALRRMALVLPRSPAGKVRPRRLTPPSFAAFERGFIRTQLSPLSAGASPCLARSSAHGQDRAFCLRNDLVGRRPGQMRGSIQTPFRVAYTQNNQVGMPRFRQFQDLIRRRAVLHQALWMAPEFSLRRDQLMESM